MIKRRYRTHVKFKISLVGLTTVFILFACTRNFSKPACTESGTVGSDQVSHPTQGFDISFQYYLPPCYEKQTNIRFPVLYLITTPFESSLDTNSNAPMSLADRLIQAEKMPPVIVVVPNDKVAQGYHRALVIDLISYVDENYNTIRDKRYRGVGGISHGGGIAARMAFQFPDRFGSLGVLSGGIASQEKETFDGWIASTSVEDLPRVRIDVGDQDGIMPLTQNLTVSWMMIKFRILSMWEQAIITGYFGPLVWNPICFGLQRRGSRWWNMIINPVSQEAEFLLLIRFKNQCIVFHLHPNFSGKEEQIEWKIKNQDQPRQKTNKQLSTSSPDDTFETFR
jgi:Putative esterase